jgi:hypothetical protein
MNFIEQITCDVTFCINNVEKLVCTGCSAVTAYRAVAGHHMVYCTIATPSFLVTATCEKGVVHLPGGRPAAALWVGGLIMLPLCVQNTWQACLEKWFQSQLPLAMVQEQC